MKEFELPPRIVPNSEGYEDVEPPLGTDGEGPVRNPVIEQAPPFDFEDEPGTRKRKQRADTGRKRGPRKAKASKLADEIRPDMEQVLALLSLGLSPLSPTAAEYNEKHVDQNVRVVANLCIRHPRLLEYIRQTGGLTAYFELFQFAVGITLCVLVDLERINPDAMLARITGVTEAYQAVYQEEPQKNGNEPTESRPGDIPVPAILAFSSPANQE